MSKCPHAGSRRRRTDGCLGNYRLCACSLHVSSTRRTTRHRTPWAHSSVPSDRIKPHSRPSTPAKNKGKAKDTSAPVQHAPKSAAVRALEATIADLTSSSGRERDAQGGCFCQARTHALASHTPLCAHCGLVLCALNPPHLAFPHCSAPLLSSSAHAAPLESLASELAAVLAREEADAQREREEARETAGAFPQHLPGEARAACSAWRVRRCRMRMAHKVLSLNAKMKHVTVAFLRSKFAGRGGGHSGHAHTAARGRHPIHAWQAGCHALVGRRLWGYVCGPRIDREELKEDRRAHKAKKARDVAESCAAAAD
ncbi:hypothetical protein DFH11DRAFT_1748167 [Phellopilus nigrolimitatus]|nr:hypothetical protein DFH11DRAFT_1748167 [Phellopilus nigrolimitatus]